MSDHSHCKTCNAVIGEFDTFCDEHFYPQPLPRQRPSLACSFCGRGKSVVEALFAASARIDTYICASCVEAAQILLSEARRKR